MANREPLRALMNLPSLVEIFSLLVIREDTDKIARDMLEVIRFNWGSAHGTEGIRSSLIAGTT